MRVRSPWHVACFLSLKAMRARLNSVVDVLRTARWLSVVAVASAILIAAPVEARQTTPAESSAPGSPSAHGKPADPAPPINVSPAMLAHIRQALSQDAHVDLNDEQLRFYIEIVAKQPRFSDYVKGYDFMNGPTKGGDPMSHREFVNMVTPKELYSSGGITATDTLQFALTNYVGQTLIKKALQDIKNAKDEKEVEAIRERVDQELAALSAPSTK